MLKKEWKENESGKQKKDRALLRELG